MKDTFDAIKTYEKYFILKSKVAKKAAQQAVKTEDDDKLVIMLKGLCQHLIQNELTETATVADLLLNFLRHSGYGELALSSRQQAVFAYTDAMTLQLMNQCRISKEMAFKVVLLKVHYAMQLLASPNEVSAAAKLLRSYTELLLKAVIGWNEHAGKRADLLLQSITLNYKQLVSLYPLTPEKIEPQYQALLDIIKQYSQQSQIIEQRITQNLNRRVLSGEADQEIELLFDQYLAGNTVPTALLVLLERFWRKYLHTVYLRDGKDSEPWKQATKLTNKLIRAWRKDSTVDLASRCKVLESLQPLFNQLHLAEDSFKLAIRAIESSVQEDVDWITVDKKQFVQLDSFNKQFSHLHDALKRLRVGDWVLFEKQGQKIRGKLLYKNLIQDKFVFSNLSGQEVLDITGEKLSKRLDSKKVIVLTGQLSSELADRLVGIKARTKYENLKATIEHRKNQIALRKQQQAAQQQLESEQIEAQRKQQELEQQRQLEEQKRMQQQQQQELEKELERQRREEQYQQELAALQKISSGAWVEFIDDEGKVTLNKLSFVLNSSGKLVFVNEIGMKTRESSREQLAQDIVDGRANIHAWGNQFESRLESLVVGQKQEIIDRKRI